MNKHILLYEQFLGQDPVNEGFKELLVSTALAIGLITSAGATGTQKEISHLGGVEYCKTIYNDSTLERAKEYWKNWLQSPETISKIAKNYKTTEDDINKNYIPKWISIIEPVKIVYKNMGPQEIAAVDTNASSTALYVNPHSTVFRPKFREKYQEDAMRTLVHELQHKMSSLIPINPEEVVTLAFGEKTDPRTGKYHRELGDEVLERIGNDLGVDMKRYKYRAYYYWDVFNSLKWANRYAKSATEITSRIDALKYKYGIKPGDRHGLKPDMFRPTFTRETVDADLDWILVVWAGYGFPPLQEFLNRLDELAVNKGTAELDKA